MISIFSIKGTLYYIYNHSVRNIKRSKLPTLIKIKSFEKHHEKFSKAIKGQLFSPKSIDYKEATKNSLPKYSKAYRLRKKDQRFP